MGRTENVTPSRKTDPVDMRESLRPGRPERILFEEAAQCGADRWIAASSGRGVGEKRPSPARRAPDQHRWSEEFVHTLANHAPVASSSSTVRKAASIAGCCASVSNLLSRIVASADSAGKHAWRLRPSTSVKQLKSEYAVRGLYSSNFGWRHSWITSGKSRADNPLLIGLQQVRVGGVFAQVVALQLPDPASRRFAVLIERRDGA